MTYVSGALIIITSPKTKAMHSAVVGSLHAMVLVTLRMEPLPEVVRHDSDVD